MNRHWTCLLIIVLAVKAEGFGDVLFYDDFSAGAFSSSWTILNNAPSYVDFSGGGLRLRCSNGDIWQNRTDAKNILLISSPTDGDLDMTLAVQNFEPNHGGWTQLDLLAFDSMDNHFRTGYGNLFDLGNTRYLTAAREVAGTYIGTGNTLHDFGASPFLLRVTKRGNAYHLYYSTDGAMFWDSGLGTSYGDGTPAYLGFVAMVDPSQQTVATISYFEVVSMPAAPVSAQAVPATICVGGSAQLFATPGSGGDAIEWFTDSCDGTPVPGGESPIVSPSVMTTYYARTRNTTTGSVSRSCAQLVLRVRLPSPADFDHDCDVDLDDLSIFQSCATGPAIPYMGDCAEADFDHDRDADQSDFGVFQRCYSGAGIPADPNCAD